MKHSLDEFIQKKREAFDTQLPPDGHLERFEQRLKRRTIGRHRRILTTAAAAVLLLVGIQFMVTREPAESIPGNVSEVAGFYNRQLEDEIEQLLPVLYRINEKEREAVLEDIRIMENETEEWKKNAPKMTEEELIALIINRYLIQIESIQHIREVLEQQAGQPSIVTL